MSENPDPARPPPDSKPRVPLGVEETLAALAMALLCVITFANVVARYLTNYSFAFTEEYSVALMVIVALLGAASATARDRHIRITYLVERWPPPRRKTAELIAIGAVVVMFGVVVVFGARMAWDDYRFEVTSPGLGLPQWIYTIWLPILSLAVVGRALGRASRVWRSGA